MLMSYPHTAEPASFETAIWIDMLNPSDAERARFEERYGLRVPLREDLTEIESTSRLQVENGALYMSVPLILAVGDEPWIPVPTGFVLSKQVLLTVRYGSSGSFDLVVKELSGLEHFSPCVAFVRIFEELIEQMADLLETSSNNLDDASHLIFRHENGKPMRIAHGNAVLRQLIIRTGSTSERMARIHYTLVCLDRTAKFVLDRCRDWIAPEAAARLQSANSDISSLVQFAEGLASRVQLLQDAATGLISIDQNEVMKVLTVASVVGIPPVLIVGVYGMNFKIMPELEWTYGYPFALLLVVLSGLLPLAWFKLKGWI
jgi:magnesium transporter